MYVNKFCDNNLYYHMRWWLDGKGLGLWANRWWIQSHFQHVIIIIMICCKFDKLSVINPQTIKSRVGIIGVVWFCFGLFHIVGNCGDFWWFLIKSYFAAKNNFQKTLGWWPQKKNSKLISQHGENLLQKIKSMHWTHQFFQFTWIELSPLRLHLTC